MSERTRGYIYRIAVAVGVVLVGYGIVKEGQLATWLELVGAILAVGGNGLASLNTSVKRKGTDRG